MSDITIDKVYDKLLAVEADVETLKLGFIDLETKFTGLETKFTGLGDKFDEMKTSTIKWVVGLFIGTIVVMVGSGSLVMTAVLLATQ